MSSINNNNKKTQAKQSKKAYKNPRKGLRDDFFNFMMISLILLMMTSLDSIH